MNERSRLKKKKKDSLMLRIYIVDRPLAFTCLNAHVHHTQAHTSDTEMYIYNYEQIKLHRVKLFALFFMGLWSYEWA